MLSNITENDITAKKRSKAYKFKHHYSERLAALTCTGPEIKDKKFLQRLKETIEKKEGKMDTSKYQYGPAYFAKMIKIMENTYKQKNVYSRKKYHERFIWLRDYLGIEKKPQVDPQLITNLKARYEAAYKAFQLCKTDPRLEPFMKRRKNIININYLTCMFLKQEKALDYIRYFSAIKGRKTNFAQLKKYWYAMKRWVSKCSIYVDENHVIHELKWDEEDVTEKEIDERSFYY